MQQRQLSFNFSWSLMKNNLSILLAQFHLQEPITQNQTVSTVVLFKSGPLSLFPVLLFITLSTVLSEPNVISVVI